MRSFLTFLSPQYSPPSADTMAGILCELDREINLEIEKLLSRNIWMLSADSATSKDHRLCSQWRQSLLACQNRALLLGEPERRVVERQFERSGRQGAIFGWPCSGFCCYLQESFSNAAPRAPSMQTLKLLRDCMLRAPSTASEPRHCQSYSMAEGLSCRDGCCVTRVCVVELVHAETCKAGSFFLFSKNGFGRAIVWNNH